MELNEVAEQLTKIIKRAECDAIQEHGSWEHRYLCLTNDLRRLIAEAVVHKKVMQEEGLTFNAIESEGFLRCAIAVRKLIDEIDGLYDSNKSEEN